MGYASRWQSAVVIEGDLYVIGGHLSYITTSSRIYRLSCSSHVCTFARMKQKLKVAREATVAIPVPSSLCIPITTTTTSKKFYNYFDQY